MIQLFSKLFDSLYQCRNTFLTSGSKPWRRESGAAYFSGADEVAIGVSSAFKSGRGTGVVACCCKANCCRIIFCRSMTWLIIFIASTKLASCLEPSAEDALGRLDARDGRGAPGKWSWERLEMPLKGRLSCLSPVRAPALLLDIRRNGESAKVVTTHRSFGNSQAVNSVTMGYATSFDPKWVSFRLVPKLLQTRVHAAESSCQIFSKNRCTGSSMFQLCTLL